MIETIITESESWNPQAAVKEWIDINYKYYLGNKSGLQSVLMTNHHITIVGPSGFNGFILLKFHDDGIIFDAFIFMNGRQLDYWPEPKRFDCRDNNCFNQLIKLINMIC